MASCYPGFDLAPPAPPTRNAPAPHKDYTRPLHVDCSVEYELPNQAKPPEGARSEPLLMIHPCYYRRAESQRRSPFINNLPTRTQSMVTVGGRRASQVPRLVQQQQQQQQTAVSIQQPQHQTQQYQVQAVRYLDPSGRPEATTMLHQQQQQHHQHMAVTNWNQMDASLVAAPAPVPVYSKPSVAAVKHMKRDPMLCRGGDFSSGSDSGVSVSAGHWTDSDRSPLAPELRLQRDFTATTDSGIGTPVDDKAVLSELLAATCGGGVEVNNNNTVHKEAVPRHQQPAVGVAAVAATPCTSCFLQPPVPYHHRLQQPWAGMTAPTASQHQPTARRARVALEPEHAAASRRAAQVPWARSGGAAKRSRLATAQSHDVSTAAATGWANQQQFVVAAAAPEAASRPSWSTPVACRQQQEPQMVAPCGGGVKDCKTCCQQPSVKGTPEQQWGSQYYGPCRGASEDNTRILWNNESMLRLFQV